MNETNIMELATSVNPATLREILEWLEQNNNVNQSTGLSSIRVKHSLQVSHIKEPEIRRKFVFSTFTLCSYCFTQ